MVQAMKELVKSKKFWMTIIGSAVCAGLKSSGASSEVVALVGGLFGSNIVGQGLADFGKNRTSQ